MDTNKVIRLANKLSDNEFSSFTPTEIYKLRNSDDYDSISTVYNFLTAEEFLLFCFILPAISGDKDYKSIISKFTSNLTFLSYIHINELNPEVDCEECSTSGEQTCHRCGGDGNVDCSQCGGSGDQDCNNCDGTGEVEDGETCSDCLGDGTESCEYCDGSGYERCENCNGRGEENCHNCDGQGYVETTDKFQGTWYYLITIDDKMISELPYYSLGDVLSSSLIKLENCLVLRYVYEVCDNENLNSDSIEKDTDYFIGFDDDKLEFEKGVNGIHCSNEGTPVIC
jgi:hypothetical protein